jgi:hypothetical protein
MNEESMQQNPPGPRQPMSRRAFVRAAGAAGAVAAGAAALVGWSSTRTQDEYDPIRASQKVVSGRISGPLPRDPQDGLWRSAAPVDVPLLAQNMATPRSHDIAIASMRLRSLHNGSEIGFHLEWQDDSVEDIEAIARFRDSVAVQLPVRANEPTSVMMGQAGRPVHILHWRASWQGDMERGGRKVRHAFPNATNDVTPEQVMGEDAARVYYPALYVGNHMATRDRVSAVEELVAEGYGSLTSHAEQRAEGRGVQAQGQWSVAIVMPLNGGTNKARLRPSETTLVAVAAWNGAANNRGARKQWSNWLGLEVEA